MHLGATGSASFSGHRRLCVTERSGCFQAEHLQQSMSSLLKAEYSDIGAIVMVSK